MRKDYKTLSEATDDLKARGYSEDFNLKQHCVECRNRNFEIPANEFEVDEVYRFEGQSNPSDSAVVYAISSEKHGIKGVLVDAYGVYADPLTTEMVEKLRYRPG